MVKINQVEFDKLKSDFGREWSRIEPYKNRRPLTKDLELRIQYREEIVRTFNNIVRFLKYYFEEGSSSEKFQIISLINPFIEKIKEAFGILHLNYTWPLGKFEEINVTLIEVLGDEDNTQDSDSGNEDTQGASGGVKRKTIVSDITATPSSANKTASTSAETVSRNNLDSPTRNNNLNFSNNLNVNPNEPIEPPIDDLNNGEELEQNRNNNPNQNDQPFDNGENLNENNNINQNNQPFVDGENPNLFRRESNSSEEEIEMAQTPRQFLQLAGSMLNTHYDGDPLKLESFLASVDLIQTMCEEANADLCFKYIKSKLDGTALECLPDDVDSVDDIVNALNANITPDSSKVVEGRLLALRLEKSNFTRFSEQAEKLSEALRRSLGVEGITKAKASEMAIAKTVELCRKTARNEIVKSVLAAATFNSPKEVISKFITENDVAKKEKQEQSVQGQNRNRFNGGNNNFRGNSRGNFNNNGNRGGFVNNNRFNNNRQNNFQNFNGNRGGFNNNRGGFNNNRGNFNRNNNFNNRNQNRGEQVIRFIAGAQQQQALPPANQNNQNNQGEQVFRLQMG